MRFPRQILRSISKNNSDVSEGNPDSGEHPGKIEIIEGSEIVKFPIEVAVAEREIDFFQAVVDGRECLPGQVAITGPDVSVVSEILLLVEIGPAMEADNRVPVRSGFFL